VSGVASAAIELYAEDGSVNHRQVRSWNYSAKVTSGVAKAAREKRVNDRDLPRFGGVYALIDGDVSDALKTKSVNVTDKEGRRGKIVAKGQGKRLLQTDISVNGVEVMSLNNTWERVDGGWVRTASVLEVRGPEGKLKQRVHLSYRLEEVSIVTNNSPTAGGLLPSFSTDGTTSSDERYLTFSDEMYYASIPCWYETSILFGSILEVSFGCPFAATGYGAFLCAWGIYSIFGDIFDFWACFGF
jgi:hypothetical protein